MLMVNAREKVVSSAYQQVLFPWLAADCPNWLNLLVIYKIQLTCVLSESRPC